MSRITIPSVKGGHTHPRIVDTRKVGKSKIKVGVIRKKVKGGFIGLNKEAAKELKIKSNLPYNEIAFYPCRSKYTNRCTKQHELIEQHCMRYGHLKYHVAHRIALRFENTRVTPSEALKWYKQQKH
jgi:hypothetical protein